MAELDPQVLPVETKLDENPNEESPTSNTPFVVKRLVGQRDKLRGQNGELDVENDDLAKEVARLTQENTQLKNVPAPQQNLPPVPQDYEKPEDYQQAAANYTAGVAQNTVNQYLQNQAQSNHDTQFNTRVDSHYQQAEKLAKPDYEQAELNTINELGQNFVNDLVDSTDNSAEILYMLGNSPKELQKIKALQLSNPKRAAVEIGRLSASAGSFNKETIPAPEDVLEPGKTPTANAGNLKKSYDAAVIAASETGDTTGLRSIRKQMKEAGLL